MVSSILRNKTFIVDEMRGFLMIEQLHILISVIYNRAVSKR
jgi:hypothetical protein